MRCPESGLGVFIMKSFMDRVEYTPGAPNVLKLTKLVAKTNGNPVRSLDDHSTNIDGGTVTLHITGELDAVSVPDLRPVLDDLISKGHKRSWSTWRACASSTARAWAPSSYLFRRVRGLGGTVVVRGATDQPLAILRLLKLDQILITESARL